MSTIVNEKALRRYANRFELEFVDAEGSAVTMKLSQVLLDLSGQLYGQHRCQTQGVDSQW